MVRMVDDPAEWWRGLRPWQRFCMRFAAVIGTSVVQVFALGGMLVDSVRKYGWWSFGTVSLLVIGLMMGALFVAFLSLFWRANEMLERQDRLLRREDPVEDPGCGAVRIGEDLGEGQEGGRQGPGHGGGS